MAKLECTLRGSVDDILHTLENAILGGSVSATREDMSCFSLGANRCILSVYERYSWTGGNRVSLSLLLVQDGPLVRLSAITSGGSQAVFFKINTFGESAFLDHVRSVVRPFLQ